MDLTNDTNRNDYLYDTRKIDAANNPEQWYILNIFLNNICCDVISEFFKGIHLLLFHRLY